MGGCGKKNKKKKKKERKKRFKAKTQKGGLNQKEKKKVKLKTRKGSSHNGFPLDLDDHKNKWSHHRSFLYGCDRSPGVHALKLGIEIPNLKQHIWSTELV